MSSNQHASEPLLRVSEWPDCIQASWRLARAPTSSLFRSGGSSQKLSSNSWRIAEEGFGKLLALLKTRSLLTKCTRLSNLVTEQHLVALVEHMQVNGLAINTQTAYLTGVAMAARILAPHDDWRWIGQGIRRLKARAPKKSLVSQAQLSCADTLSIGKRVFREAWRGAAMGNVEQAVRARDGLILAFISVRPFRRNELASLRLGEHVLIAGDDVEIYVPAALMKGKKRPYNADWSANLKSELFCYVDSVRPTLLAGHSEHAGNSAGDALWVSERGTALTSNAIYRQIRHLTQQVTGRPINLHQFRTIAASTIAIHAPEQIDLAQEVLGHIDARSKEFYIQADQLIAVRRSHQLEDEVLRAAAREERNTSRI